MSELRGIQSEEREGGFSFLELIIAFSLLLMMAYLVGTLSISGMDAQKYAERMARVTEITQDVMDEMRNKLSASVHLFTDDTIGVDYLKTCDISSLPTPIDTIDLPTLAANGLIERDTTTLQKTGNTLFFARYAWADEFLTTSSNVYRIDIYRLELFYLSPDGGGPRLGAEDGINLSHWVSEPLADGTQIDQITDPVDQAEVLLHLLSQTPDTKGATHDKVDVVWRLGEDLGLADTLRQIDSTGGLSQNTIAPRTPGWEFLPEPSLCGSLLYFRYHSVATNYARPVMGVGRFGIIDNTNDGFPHGLEVQIVGPSSARQVMVHLTLVSTNNKGHKAYYDMQTISDTRDL